MIQSIRTILGGPGGGDYLARIYLSTKFQEYLATVHPEPVKVVVKDKIITLACKSPAQATFFRLRRRRMYGEIANMLGKGHGYMVRVKIGR